MSNQTAVTQTINIVPVQGIFTPNAELVSLIGPGGVPFYPAVSPILTNVTIIDSTIVGGSINDTVIGNLVPSTAVFTDMETTTGRVIQDPVNQYDLVNKAYVDLIAAGGLIVRQAAACATTANLTSLSGLLVIDGYQTVAGDRVLVKNQSSAQFNGVYVADSGAWSRSTDMDAWSEINNSYVFVNNGTVNQLSSYVASAAVGGTIDVTPIYWNVFSASKTYSAGNGLQLTTSVFSVLANGTTINVSSSGIKLSDTYAGQTSITTLGTIATGTWQGSAIAILYGGTGATTASGARTNLGAAASGANSDITSLSGISGAITSPNYIGFNTSYATALTAGQLGWDGNNTLGLGMAGGNVTQHIGEDQFFYTKASATITKGQVVMFTGAVGASGVPIGAPATGITDGSYIMGIAAENIAHNGFGLVQTFGILRNVDTSTYADGDILWYNPAVTGGLTTTKPSAPNVKVQMAAVVNGGSAGGGTILIRINAGSQLGGTDSNVQIATPPSNNDLLQYYATGQYWRNIAPSSLTGVGSVANSVTFNNSGTGDASGISFDGSAVKTVSYNTLGAPKADGTGASGTWAISISGNAATATSATSATSATNVASGSANQLVYQTGASTTSFVTAPTVSSTYLQWNGSAFVWATVSAGITITDDTTTNATRYLTFTDATSGTITGENTASTKLQFNPSTGALTATSLTPTNALAVSYGGSGATTLTGIIKGNGTSAFSAATAGTDYLAPPSGTALLKANSGGALANATAGTDYVAPGTATTFTATQTFNGSSSTFAAVFANIGEVATVTAAAPSSTTNYDVTTQSVQYYTSNATTNFTLNIRASSGTSLNTLLATGQSTTLTLLVTNGSTAYYPSTIQIDGNTVTPKWQGGTAPTGGNASSIDVYTFAIVKTASATFTVLGSQTKFA